MASKKEELKNILRNKEENKAYLRWLVAYTKPYLPSLIGIMLLNMLTTVLATKLIQINQIIIDDAGKGKPIQWSIALFVGIMFINTFISIGLSLVSIVLGERFAFGIRRNIYEKILRSKWSSISKYHTGDLNTRLTSDADAIANGIANNIPAIFQLTFSLAYSFYILAKYSLFLAVLSLTISPIAIIVSYILGRKLKVLQVKVQESEARYRSFIQESLSNIMIVKSFCNEDYFSEKLNEHRNDRLYWILKKTRMTLATSSVINISFQIAYIVAFSWGALQIYEGNITFGMLQVFISLSTRVQSPLVGLAQTIPKIVSIIASAGRVIELQNLPLEDVSETNIDSTQVGINVDTITFGYSKGTIFEDASLTIQPGDFVAIVGESGIGKTTLIRLMMSFLSSEQGQINFFNPQGDTEATTASSRNFISYVPQGNTLFSGTIADNVRMGREDATDDEVLEALKASSAYDFVKDLPDGMDTEIGEKGHGISEGQAQRVALARALVRKAPFLVLDEATASLDEKTELRVLEGIRALDPKPTCILITHRRSVLNYCDREIKIEDKKINDIPLGLM